MSLQSSFNIANYFVFCNCTPTNVSIKNVLIMYFAGTQRSMYLKLIVWAKEKHRTYFAQATEMQRTKFSESKVYPYPSYTYMSKCKFPLHYLVKNILWNLSVTFTPLHGLCSIYRLIFPTQKLFLSTLLFLRVGNTKRSLF